MIKVEQKYSGQYWITRPGESTYSAGAAEAAKVLKCTIEDVHRLVIAVIENNAEVVA
ncbi:hypothetical protein [Exiguobacterium sp. ZWU0009]|uniref:hypothetical protein n=1 Tax=Exiguobacterium sp. ZWU0009 TaxID=1224749 RepID=UPI000B207969|nr:hypothetical protein [Exiguobacterium sp. ZWU0009]